MSKSLLHVSVAIILNLTRDQIYIAKRDNSKHKGGYWEFPGGKLKDSEKSHQALIRETQEEIGITPTDYSLLESVSYEYPEKCVQLDFYLVRKYEGVVTGNEGQEVRWVKVSDIKSYQFPEANQCIINKLDQLI